MRGADYQQLIDIIETVYRGASKGRGLVVSPKGALSATLSCTVADFISADYSTRYRY